jgi:hypothetical protein
MSPCATGKTLEKDISENQRNLNTVEEYQGQNSPKATELRERVKHLNEDLARHRNECRECE